MDVLIGIAIVGLFVAVFLLLRKDKAGPVEADPNRPPREEPGVPSPGDPDFPREPEDPEFPRRPGDPNIPRNPEP